MDDGPADALRLDLTRDPVIVTPLPGLSQVDARDQCASVLLPPAQAQRVMIMGGAPGGGDAIKDVDIADFSVRKRMAAQLCGHNLRKLHRHRLEGSGSTKAQAQQPTLRTPRTEISPHAYVPTFPRTSPCTALCDRLKYAGLAAGRYCSRGLRSGCRRGGGFRLAARLSALGAQSTDARIWQVPAFPRRVPP